MLPFLQDKGVISQKYRPMFCLPRSEKFSRDATTQEKKDFWEEVDPLLLEAKDRVVKELAKRAESVSIDCVSRFDLQIYSTSLSRLLLIG